MFSLEFSEIFAAIFSSDNLAVAVPVFAYHDQLFLKGAMRSVMKI